jgi:hypothetical protein
MGAWGPGNFENDNALDWASDVEEGGVPHVRAALQEAAEPPDENALLIVPHAAAALAAAEIVAAAFGHGGPKLPDAVIRFLSRKPVFERRDVDLAIAAATCIEQQSELHAFGRSSGR